MARIVILDVCSAGALLRHTLAHFAPGDSGIPKPRIQTCFATKAADQPCIKHIPNTCMCICSG